MLLLAALLAGFVSAATVKEGLSGRPRLRPPVQLPEDILYLVLDHLSSILVFREARDALSACELVSHTFHRLVKRHKDEHLLLQLQLHSNTATTNAEQPLYALNPSLIAKLDTLVAAGLVPRVRSVEFQPAPCDNDRDWTVLEMTSYEAHNALFKALSPDTAVHTPSPPSGSSSSSSKDSASDTAWSTLSYSHFNSSLLCRISDWHGLCSLTLLHLSSGPDQSPERSAPPPDLTHLSLQTPVTVYTFRDFFPSYGKNLTSLSLPFPLLAPDPTSDSNSTVAPGSTTSKWTCAPDPPFRLDSLPKLQTLTLKVFTSRAAYLSARSVSPTTLLQLHLPSLLSTSSSSSGDGDLSRFRLTLEPCTPADALVLERAWRNKRGALQSLVQVERVRAVDATPLGLGWYD